jgi:hypothetical protein
MKTCVYGSLAVAALVLATPAVADVTVNNTNPSLSITQVQDDVWQPEDFEPGVKVPAIHLASASIVIDGREIEPEWDKAVEVTVPLQYGNVPEVRLKAMYTDDEVFIRVRWPDPEANRQHRPWVWDAEVGRYVESPQVEDSVMLSFEAGCEWTPSLLGGYLYDFDAWQWMAARSDPLGQAVDLYGNVRAGRDGLEDFYEYESRVQEEDWQMKIIENHDVDLHAPVEELDRVYIRQSATKTLQIRAVPDGGRHYPAFAERLPAPESAPDDPTETYPQYSPLPLLGGAGEVPAKGHWEDGWWTVEFRRVRVTPAEHIYDTILNRTVQFSVHVFNGTERMDEVAESPRLYLQFMPEEQPLIARD